MENTNLRFGLIFKLLGLLLCILAILFNNFDLDFLKGLDSEIKFSAVSIFVLILADITLFIKENSRFSYIIFQSLNPFKLTKKLRISMAYLIQIKVDDEYLLVYSQRRNSYQPVGGVYKYDPRTLGGFFESLKIFRDKDSEVDNGENDLRLYLYRRYNLSKFIRWFMTNQSRESDPWREFHEELVSTRILSPDVFFYIDYNRKWRIFEKIRFDKFRGIETFYYADIYEVYFTNTKQFNEIEKLKTIKSDKYIWVSSTDIEKGYKEINGIKHKIADNTWKIIDTTGTFKNNA
jgi:hypothetical protein